MENTAPPQNSDVESTPVEEIQTEQPPAAQPIEPILTSNEPASQDTAKSPFIIFIVIAFLIISGGILAYRFYSKPNTSTPKAQPPKTTQAAIPTPTINPVSNEQLDKDLADIDNTLVSLDENVSNVDQALSDKPGDLTSR